MAEHFELNPTTDKIACGIGVALEVIGFVQLWIIRSNDPRLGQFADVLPAVIIFELLIIALICAAYAGVYLGKKAGFIGVIVIHSLSVCGRWSYAVDHRYTILIIVNMVIDIAFVTYCSLRLLGSSKDLWG